MIYNIETVKLAESKSGKSVDELIEMVSSKIAKYLMDNYDQKHPFLFLCGKGHNGDDSANSAKILNDNGYKVKVCYLDKPTNNAYLKKIKGLIIDQKELFDNIDTNTIIVDGVYGFSFHGELNKDIRKIFSKINKSKNTVISIDVNSGVEADSGFVSEDALISDTTLAIGAYKPFHMLRKNHHLFNKCVLLDIKLPKQKSKYLEINEDIFFKKYPKRKEDAHKTTEGKVLIFGGSYGMSGSIMINTLGAKAAGTSFIEVAVEESIYHIVGPHVYDAVYHPFNEGNVADLIPNIQSAKAICLGSGLTNLSYKRKCLEIVLQNATCPVVVDAEGLRMLQNDLYLIRLSKASLIMTPHIKEFSDMIGSSIDDIKKNPLVYAKDFAKQYNVTIVLKIPNTIVATPDGDIYINQSGNQSLAVAGAGDYLAGIISALLSKIDNPFEAVSMGVYLHGLLADKFIENHSIYHLNFDKLNEEADKLFFIHQ